ncbi:hypothetical protein, unlikely [Trypanosoma brucei gambiense DAL972]|uniref:Uncharacterized protein n=1 Tax=Trypanosoma brucei gambiense (strain MHOM/CI/86/DAL972) TaxID=679716 RepID=C9ZT02_TRYB9|nr:hypothetical protein, unlikely [Trypanosoma brucei gambiense DAL972]CBH12537.1 hypothetical protein, unlikely [Trypanosoma brucei gambiense DAL972]|eukprot:XP_011774817.1 hypothetical protein, unlikely [Trypanosoma brucei gambiense DAL972]
MRISQNHVFPLVLVLATTLRAYVFSFTIFFFLRPHVCSFFLYSRYQPVSFVVPVRAFLRRFAPLSGSVSSGDNGCVAMPNLNYYYYLLFCASPSLLPLFCPFIYLFI